MKFLTILTIFLSNFFLAAASHAAAPKADESLAKIQKAGKLVVAIDATYPPMESEGPDGKPVGFDIDVANELAKRLGVKAEFIVMNWDGILAGLVSNRYDVIISSMNVTPERARQVNFVEYVRMSQLFVAKSGVKVANEKELAGKVVAVQADTTSHAFVQAKQKEKIAVKEVKAFKMATDAFAAVKAGQADVIVIDEPVGKYYVKRDPKTFAITGHAIQPEPVGIAIRKNDKTLEEAIGKTIAGMKKDGTLKNISVSWFGGELGT